MRNRVRVFLTGLFSVIMISLLFTAPAFAVDALGLPKKTAQPDGSMFQSSMKGDEFFHYYLDGKNRLIQKDRADGYWKYVTADAGGSLKLSGKADTSVPSGLLDADSLTDEEYRKEYYTLAGDTYVYRAPYVDDPIDLNEIPDSTETQDASSDGTESVEKLQGSSGDTEKSIPVAVIVVGFPNVDYDADYDWGTIMFNSPDNDLSDFYRKMSGGKFTFTPAREKSRSGYEGNTNLYDRTNDGVIHVKVTASHKGWSSNCNTAEPGIHCYMKDDLYQVFSEAIAKAQEDIDFPSYDRDGDGRLSKDELAFAFIFAGSESAGEESSLPGIWAHQWSFYPGIECRDAAGKRAKAESYIVIGENFFYNGNRHHGALGTLTHELGHYIGLPDLYDTKYTKNGEWDGFNVYDTSLMSHGSWGVTGPLENAATEFVPTFLDSWCRKELGFFTPEEITQSGTYPVDRLGGNGAHQCYLVKTPHEDEYYLIENREMISFDRGMKRSYFNNNVLEGGGIVVWHIDQGIVDTYGYTGSNQVNVTTHRPGVMPLYYEIGSESDATPEQKAWFEQEWQEQNNDGTGPASGPVYRYPMRNASALYNNPFPTSVYNGDKKTDRTRSGIIIQALSGPGEQMTVKVVFQEYKPVTDITGIPESTVPGRSLTLNGICTPSDATNQDILWEITDDGGTGAELKNGKVLKPYYEGTVRLKATIKSGKSQTEDFTKEFEIRVSDLILNNVQKGDVLYSGCMAVYLASSSNATPADAEEDTGTLPDGEVGEETTASGSDAAYVRFFEKAEDTEPVKVQKFTANLRQELESGFGGTRKWIVSKVSKSGTRFYIDVIPGKNGTFTITASAGEGGTISPSGTVTVEEGSDVTFMFKPAKGYRVWQVITDRYNDQGRVNSYTFSNLDYDSEIHVDFERTGTSSESDGNDSGSISGRGAYDSRYDGVWQKDGKGWWFRYHRGGWPVNTWLLIAGKWYHFGADGYMQTGWIKDRGKWYYLNPDGSMALGWKKIVGKWYFFNTGSAGVPYGALLQSTTTPDGFRVNENGEWIRTEGS